MTNWTKDRVKETTATVGTGPLTLSGAVTTDGSFVRFGSFMAVGDTCDYGIKDAVSNAWETGQGTYTAANTLTRTTVYGSSAAGAAVSLVGNAATEIFLTLTSNALSAIQTTASATQTTANAAIPTAAKGAANGVAGLDVSGKVLAVQLASALPTATAVQLYGGSGVAGGAAAVTLGTNLSMSGATLNAAGSSAIPVTTTYTAASGAIAPTDQLSLMNSATAQTYTLANGTVDGFMVRIKRYGAGTVAITAIIDGVSQTYNMSATGTLKEAVYLRMILSLASYIVE